MSFASVEAAAATSGLMVMGALHPARCDAKQLHGGTLILLGAGAGFWPVYSHSDEARDRQPHPVDRWSTRVVGDLARHYGASAYYPFGGPPYEPIIDWALKSGRAFVSPVGMMVHDTVGLLISYRGALHFEAEIIIPTPVATSPCQTCPDQPCVTACPVSALREHAPYDLDLCRTFLDTKAGKPCMAGGCLARRACPFSAGAGRLAEQSALHMKAFHPG